MRTVVSGCLDGSHNHNVLAVRHPLDRDGEPGPEWLITVWLCPVLHSVGIMLQDLRVRESLGPGGPLDER